ncbi:FAD-binding oxidoreductase [Paraferrimonas sp. SM1919]|uniref:NAD(P)/FAD-dependent oxidoreductase n=1 Tax=Paraferrimonas sp. SM1919 TaxID=2662263 RepID=UPI0013D283DA|nr:FAD-binding oxidoreductase [Paraferrimonas sp. SM1919]
MSYDPLIDPSPQHTPFASSLWASQIQLGQANPSIQCDANYDVAIIGGGYTGLLTAYYLATEHQRKVCVLEANQIGFGASARNAGFVLKGSGRLGFADMAKRWDVATAEGIYREFSDAVMRVESLIEQHSIDCEPQTKGYYKVAHHQKAAQALQRSCDFINKHIDAEAYYVNGSELQQQLMNNAKAYGALKFSDGFGVQPLKLLLGYKQMCTNAGVDIFENTLVESYQLTTSGYEMSCAGGNIQAKQMVLASNAYGPKSLDTDLVSRYLPILSSVMVTKPLSAQQLAQVGLSSKQLVMDTRRLKYYYRLLPDNRLLFGGRGAIRGRDANKAVYYQRLQQAMAVCFPVLAQQPIEYKWHGWIAAALDDMPHVYAQNGQGYSIGYCGSGVSFSAQAGYRLAQMLSGEKVPQLPLYSNPAPKFPLAPLRRVGQWGYYQYGRIADKWF